MSLSTMEANRNRILALAASRRASVAVNPSNLSMQQELARLEANAAALTDRILAMVRTAA